MTYAHLFKVKIMYMLHDYLNYKHTLLRNPGMLFMLVMKWSKSNTFIWLGDFLAGRSVSLVSGELDSLVSRLPLRSATLIPGVYIFL